MPRVADQVRERIVLLARAPDPQHVVEQQLVVVVGGQPLAARGPAGGPSPCAACRPRSGRRTAMRPRPAVWDSDGTTAAILVPPELPQRRPSEAGDGSSVPGSRRPASAVGRLRARRYETPGRRVVSSPVWGDDGQARPALACRRPPPRRSDAVSIGPVQLIVLGFSKPDFKGEVIEELGRLRDSDVVRVDRLADRLQGRRGQRGQPRAEPDGSGGPPGAGRLRRRADRLRCRRRGRGRGRRRARGRSGRRKR